MTDIILKTLIHPLLDTWIKPKVQKIISSSDNNIKYINHKLFENYFNEYIARRYNKFYFLDTIIFQNIPKPLHELYQPLTVERDRSGHSFLDLYSDPMPSINKYRTLITGYPTSLMERFERLLICDYAGMGKSTLLRKVFLSIIENNKGVPILVELRKLNKNHKIFSEIVGQLVSYDTDISEDFVRFMIKSGDFIFLLDGVDEIPTDDKDSVINDICKFIEFSYGCKFLIASRPEKSLVNFRDFEPFTISHLKKNEALELLRKYDKFHYKSIIDPLIENIDKEENKSIAEFLTNPLLVTLIYRAFDYKRKLPLSKSSFYRQVFDALYENHDLSKEGFFIRSKSTNLHLDDFEKVMRYLGFFTVKAGKIEFTRNELIDLIDEIKNIAKDVSFKSTDLIDDLTKNVPLFREEGLNYKWAHKSMQDYFMARFVFLDAKESQKNILLSMFNNETKGSYINIIDIFMEMDYLTFRNTIVYEMVTELHHFYLENYSENDKVEHTSVGAAFFSVFNSKRPEFTKWVIFSKLRMKNISEDFYKLFSSVGLYKFDFEMCMQYKREIEHDLNKGNEDIFRL